MAAARALGADAAGPDAAGPDAAGADAAGADADSGAAGGVDEAPADIAVGGAATGGGGTSGVSASAEDEADRTKHTVAETRRNRMGKFLLRRPPIALPMPLAPPAITMVFSKQRGRARAFAHVRA